MRLFATAPQSRDVPRERYPGLLADVARWTEQGGCEGILIYTDNGILDPWLVSHLVIQATERLSPLIAVQPAYMHPYTVAKMVSSLAHLHGRRTYLNLVAGGFRSDLEALGDETPHDQRYARVVEYGRIIEMLTSGAAPVTLRGRFYNVGNLRLRPPVAPELRPALMLSGSSPAGLAAARALDAIAVRYPQPPHREAPPADGLHYAVRIGIVARPSADEAWRAALARFPEDRSGQIAHRLAMDTSDSQWHRQLAELAERAAGRDQVYWLGPFENYKTFCPYLVGDYGRVAGELRRYIELGVRTFILDVVPSGEELEQTRRAFDLAQEPARA